MPVPASPAALPQYYIADGVHRAVAARENGLSAIPARLVVQGQSDRFFYANIDHGRSNCHCRPIETAECLAPCLCPEKGT
jgi:hypothetical protein